MSRNNRLMYRNRLIHSNFDEVVVILQSVLNDPIIFDFTGERP